MQLQQNSQLLLKVDTATVFELSRKVKSDLKLLHQLVDTLELKSAKIISDAYAERSQLFYFKKHYAQFIIELKYSTQQMKQLQQDLNNGLLTTEKFNQYYQQEKEIIVNLNKKIQQSIEEMNVALEVILKNTATVDSLLLQIQASPKRTVD